MSTQPPKKSRPHDDLHVDGFQILDSPSHEKTEILFNYWKSKCGGNRMPFVKGIDLLDNPHLLPCMGLIDVVLTGKVEFRIRLYGTEAVYIAGEDRTGKNIEEFAGDLPEETREMLKWRWRWRRALLQAYETRQPRFTRGRRSDPQKNSRFAHTAILPLTTDGETVSRMLGMILTDV